MILQIMSISPSESKFFAIQSMTDGQPDYESFILSISQSATELFVN